MRRVGQATLPGKQCILNISRSADLPTSVLSPESRKSSRAARSDGPMRRTERAKEEDRRQWMGNGWRVVVLTVVLSLCGCRTHRTSVSPDVSAAAAFQRCCARCHGARGQGGSGADLRGLSDAPADIAAIITHGQGKMPPFGRTLTPSQIQSLAV